MRIYKKRSKMHNDMQLQDAFKWIATVKPTLAKGHILLKVDFYIRAGHSLQVLDLRGMLVNISSSLCAILQLQSPQGQSKRKVICRDIQNNGQGEGANATN